MAMHNVAFKEAHMLYEALRFYVRAIIARGGTYADVIAFIIDLAGDDLAAKPAVT